jgi:hypothetical protein
MPGPSSTKRQFHESCDIAFLSSKMNLGKAYCRGIKK